jgi:hypothetical protein
MFCVMEMFGGVFILGRVATSRMTADQAHAEMYPRVAGFNTIFADMFIRLPDLDFTKMSTLLCHSFSLFQAKLR